MPKLTVTHAAKSLNVSESFLRKAERRGAIPKAKRDLNGWRVYSTEDIESLRDTTVQDPT